MAEATQHNVVRRYDAEPVREIFERAFEDLRAGKTPEPTLAIVMAEILELADEEVWDQNQLAKVLSTTPKAVEGWRMKDEGPPYFRLGGAHRGSPRYLKSEVLRWAKSRSATGRWSEAFSAQLG